MRLTKVALLMAGAQLFAGIAYAQDRTAHRIEPKEKQMGLFSERAARPIDRELSHRSALGHEGETMNSSSYDLRWFSIEEDDEHKWGEGNQDPENPKEPPKKEQKPFSPTATRQMVIPDSISGFDANLNDKAQTKMIGEQLQSPLATMFITWQLTEPGVATGAASAMAQSNLLLLSRYASQDALMKQMTDEDRQAYFNCISTKLADGQTGAAGGDKKANWVAAMSKCIGDKYESRSTSTGGLDTESDPNAISMEGTRFTIADNPNAEDTDEYVNSSFNKKELTLTSLLFGPKKKNNSGTTNETRSEQFREDFIKYIGDIKFRELPPEGSISTEVDDTTRGVKIEQERREPEVSPDQIYKDWVPFYYVKLMKLMKLRCESMNKKAGGGSGGGNTNCNVKDPGGKTLSQSCRGMDSLQEDPKNSGGTGPDNMDDLVKYLSMPGFIFKSISVDPIFVLFRRKSNDCEEQYDSDFYSINNLMAYPEDVSEEHRATFFLARKIAIGKMLAAYIKVEEVIKRTNTGVVPGWVRETALGLLSDVAGTSDLHRAYENSIEELRTYLETMQEAIASRYPDLMADVMAQRRNPAGSSGFLSPQQQGGQQR